MSINGQHAPFIKPVPVLLLKEYLKNTSGVNFVLWLCGVLHSNKDGTEFCSRDLVISETGYSKGRISRARTYWQKAGGLVDTTKRKGRKGKIPVWQWRGLDGQTVHVPIPYVLRSHIKDFLDPELRLLCLLMAKGFLVTGSGEAPVWISHYDSERFLIPHLARELNLDTSTVYRDLSGLSSKGLLARGKIYQLDLTTRSQLGNPEEQRPIIAVGIPKNWLAKMES
jgi:hypothetical protein